MNSEELFVKLNDKGYDTSQITQLQKLANNISEKEFNRLLEQNITIATDTNVLRRYNKICKFKQYNYIYCDKLSEDNFQLYIECCKNFDREISDKIGSLIEKLNNDASKIKPVIELIEKENLPKDLIKLVLFDVRAKRFNLINNYLKPEYLENEPDDIKFKRIETIRYILKDKKSCEDLISYISKLDENGINHTNISEDAFTSDKNYLMKNFHRYIGCNLDRMNNLLKNGFGDIEKLINNYDSDTIDEIIDAKREGYDVTRFLRKDFNKDDVIIVTYLMYDKLSDEDINKFFDLYPGVSKIEFYEWIVDLYVEGYRDFGQYLDKWKAMEIYTKVKLMNNLDDPKMIAEIKNADFRKAVIVEKLDCLCKCLDAKRLELINILYNADLGLRGHKAYQYIAKILENDVKNNTRHKITNLLFDKADDVFGEFNKEYAFSCEQVEALAEYILKGNITDEDIEPIRNKEIPAENMNFIAYMMSEHMNTDLIIKNATKFDIDDIKSIERCMKIGLNVTER